jgi:hypothetical protein
MLECVVFYERGFYENMLISVLLHALIFMIHHGFTLVCAFSGLNTKLLDAEQSRASCPGIKPSSIPHRGKATSTDGQCPGLVLY